MHISVIGFDIAKQVFQFMGSMCRAGLGPSCACAGRRWWSTSDRFHHAWLVWRLARLPTTGRVSC
jgi:hypothetical protein